MSHTSNVRSITTKAQESILLQCEEIAREAGRASALKALPAMSQKDEEKFIQQWEESQFDDWFFKLDLPEAFFDQREQEAMWETLQCVANTTRQQTIAAALGLIEESLITNICTIVDARLGEAWSILLETGCALNTAVMWYDEEKHDWDGYYHDGSTHGHTVGMSDLEVQAFLYLLSPSASPNKLEAAGGVIHGDKDSVDVDLGDSPVGRWLVLPDSLQPYLEIQDTMLKHGLSPADLRKYARTLEKSI